MLLAGCGREETPDLVAGKAQFVQKCGSCHALAKAGTNGNVGPKLDDLKTAAAKFGKQQKLTPEKYVEQSILQPEAFTVPGFPKGVMPSYEGRLKPEQVQALVKYLLGQGK